MRENTPRSVTVRALSLRRWLRDPCGQFSCDPERVVLASPRTVQYAGSWWDNGRADWRCRFESVTPVLHFGRRPSL